MKTYFVVSDVHGFYFELKKALKEAGFNKNNPGHFLIVCGDAFDRGYRAIDVFNFLNYMNKHGRLIYIRGNHEDLLLKLIDILIKKEYIEYYHISNGTLDTISQFTEINVTDLLTHNYDSIVLKNKLQPLILFINTNTLDYYELNNYIFVHGWVPYILHDGHCSDQKEGEFSCAMTPEVELNAATFMWEHARWENGMQAWHMGVKIPNKIIVCGHWHTSFGNYKYHHVGSGEFTEDSCYEPFIDDGIIALDACTAYTKKVNVYKIDIKN